MNAEEKLALLVTAVDDMRQWQKRFYGAQKYSKQKDDALDQSKRAERDVDRVMAIIKSEPMP